MNAHFFKGIFVDSTGLVKNRHVQIIAHACSILTSSRLALSVTEHHLRIENLVIEHGIEPVLASFDQAFMSTNITTARRMCALIALQYIAIVFGSDREPCYREQISPLISCDRLALSSSAFSAGVVGHVYANRADLSVKWLLEKFAWLKKHNVHDAGPLNISAAYVCKEFGKFDLALQFSYLAYSNAFHSGTEAFIQLANYFLLNTHRLTFNRSMNLQGMFDQKVSKLEAGQFDLGLHINYMLPVYAASQEVITAKPDLQRADRMLALADELGNFVDGNCQSSWAAAKGVLALHRGRVAQATEYLHQSETCQERADATIEPLRQKLRLGLGLREISPIKGWTPASGRAWRMLQTCAETQSTMPKSG